MRGFVSKHPWMTFFLGLAAISTVGAIVAPATMTRVAGALRPMPGGPKNLFSPKLPPKKVG